MRHVGSSTSVDAAVRCAQTRRHLSLARMLIPLPAALEHHHPRRHQAHDEHHPQDAFDSSEDDVSLTKSMRNFSSVVALLSADSSACAMQVSSGGGVGAKILYFAWSGSDERTSSSVGNQQIPQANAELHTAQSSPTPSTSSFPTPAITLHRIVSALSSASSPPFFPISHTLQLPPYPSPRHITLLPPCAAAQVRFTNEVAVVCIRDALEFFFLIVLV